jgi:hypothetical protein
MNRSTKEKEFDNTNAEYFICNTPNEEPAKITINSGRVDENANPENKSGKKKK